MQSIFQFTSMLHLSAAASAAAAEFPTGWEVGGPEAHIPAHGQLWTYYKGEGAICRGATPLPPDRSSEMATAQPFRSVDSAFQYGTTSSQLHDGLGLSALDR